MKPSSDGAAASRTRSWNALAIWATLASFGILIGFLALGRNFERGGVGRRWRRAHATGEQVDALLAHDELEEAS
jgi:hypothetical protein